MPRERSFQTDVAWVSALHLRAPPRPDPRGVCLGTTPSWAGTGGLSCLSATRDLEDARDHSGAVAVVSASETRHAEPAPRLCGGATWRPGWGL